MRDAFDRTVWQAAVLLLLLSALAASVAVARAPARVGTVHLVVTDIYSPEEVESASGLLRFSRRLMNGIHPSTRQHVIRREVLVRPGDVLDERLLRETERNLRGLGFLTHVSVVPVDTLPDGTVDLEVRVQEAWSLSTTANYSRSSEGDRWGVFLSDSNFLGQGVRLEAGLGADEERDFRQLVFANRRLFGSPLAVRVVSVELSDGHNRSLSLTRPWYTEDQAWGLEAVLWDRQFEPRFYLDPDRLDASDDRLYTGLPLDEQGVLLWAGRRLRGGPERRIWRVGIGAWVDERRYRVSDAVTLSDGRVVSGESVRDAAGEGLELAGGTHARPVLVVETLGRSWIAESRVLRLGPVEDLNLDPWLRLICGPDLAAWGSGRERLRIEWKCQDWTRLGPGLLFLRSEGEGSLGSSRNRSLNATLEGGWFAHTGRRTLDRIVFELGVAEAAVGDELQVLGLTRGLRTLEYDGRVGDRLVRWGVEHVQLLPGEILGFYSLGLAAFYAAGDTWWRSGVDASGIRHELGLGLRFGPTRSARAEVARLDLTWPTDGGGPVLTAATGGFF